MSGASPSAYARHSLWTGDIGAALCHPGCVDD